MIIWPESKSRVSYRYLSLIYIVAKFKYRNLNFARVRFSIDPRDEPRSVIARHLGSMSSTPSTPVSDCNSPFSSSHVAHTIASHRDEITDTL